MAERGTPTKKPSYWFVLVPILLGATTCGGSLFVMANKIEGMTRVPVPRPCSAGRWAGDAPISPQASIAPMTNDDPPSTPKACRT